MLSLANLVMHLRFSNSQCCLAANHQHFSLSCYLQYTKFPINGYSSRTCWCHTFDRQISGGKKNACLHIYNNPIVSSQFQSSLFFLIVLEQSSSSIQVEGFLRLMQKQIHSAGKRGFFSKKSVGPQIREKFTFEDMLCFQKVTLLCLVQLCAFMYAKIVKV